MSEPTDSGPHPDVINIEETTPANKNFRTTWGIGAKMQLTVMPIPVGVGISREIHEDTDQFLRLEQSGSCVRMGAAKDELVFDEEVTDDSIIFIPPSMWHNVANRSDESIRLKMTVCGM